MRARICGVLVGAVCFAAVCIAGQESDGIVYSGPTSRFMTKNLGDWQPRTYLGEHGAGATKAEVQAIDENVKRIQTLLMDTPTGKNPVGFFFNPAGFWYSSRKPNQPITQGLGLFPQAIFELRDHDTWKLDRGMETEPAEYSINRIGEIAHASSTLLEERLPRGETHPLYAVPQPAGTIGGFPVYGKALFIARPGHSLWKAVSVGRALNVAMPEYIARRDEAEHLLVGYKQSAAELQSGEHEKKELETFEKDHVKLLATDPKEYEEQKRQWMAPVIRQKNARLAEANPQRGDKTSDWYWGPIDALAEAQKQLASLTPEEAAAPACFEKLTTANGHEWGTFIIRRKGSSAGCQELVETNNEYYDRTLPRTAIQLITVTNIPSCVTLEGSTMVSSSKHTYPGGCLVHARMWQELNWQKMAELLVK